MYKVGPILTLNHGMGFGSLAIALHEVAKLLRYAEAKDYCFVRMGTSGGLGAEPGDVIITREGMFLRTFKTFILFKHIDYDVRVQIIFFNFW